MCSAAEKICKSHLLITVPLGGFLLDLLILFN